jgi:hypothetical protein
VLVFYVAQGLNIAVDIATDINYDISGDKNVRA